MQARLDLLRDRLQDQRSGKVLVLSHCLLNQNVRYLGGAVHPGMVDEALEEARRHGYGLYQLPCPEQRAWGGVLKRSLVPAYAAEGTLRYRLRRPLLWLFTRSTSLRYRLLARRAASDVRDYLRSGFKVTGIVGVAGSPSCGVRRTLNLSGAQVRTYRARAATAAELERYWPQLLRVWPAYERFYRQGGRRSVFVLDPPPRSNPNRRNRSRPEASPGPSLLGDPAFDREMGVALLQGLPDLGNSWLGGGSRSRGSEGA